ncbi:unnamed protein product [Zymoseptoria tritici ST99CH_3D1]|nr:unnamed protein product [Zymoseptoria tritici ST99CH_3D1]
MADQDQSNPLSPYRSDGKLYGFVCIVTGATSPIGKAIVAELAAHGAACVYACSASPSDDFASLADGVNEQFPNTKVIGYPFRNASEEDTLGLIDDALNAWGRLDIYVATSVLHGPSSISETTPNDLIKLFEANSMAAFFALKYAPPAMQKLSPQKSYPNASPKPQPYGSIIVVTTTASINGGSSNHGPALTMSSHAALGVVKAGVSVLKGTGVRINCVSAGDVDDGSKSAAAEMSGSGKTAGSERVGLPVEVARVAGFLASGFSSYVSGTNMVVDGGRSSIVGPMKSGGTLTVECITCVS